MRSLKIASLVFFAFFFVSCADIDDDDNISGIGQSCESNFDCPIGLTCDAERKVCTNGSDSGDSGHSGNGDTDSDTGNTPGKQDGDDDPITGSCTPGKKQTCPYQGSPETENVGLCKAAVRTCKEDGTWGKCEGGYLPTDEIGELCGDGIDNDCNGTVDDGTDFDGDGYGACSDCCESTEQCANPKESWDPAFHICEYEVIQSNCESEVSGSSIDPVDYAKAIGICQTTTEDSDEWGLISAVISAPNGNANVHAGSNGLLSKLGNVIKPKSGTLMLGLSSGKVADPFTSYALGSTSGAPADWLAANGGKFPSSASCSSQSIGTTGNVNDAVMLTMRIRTPKTAKSFSFNLYFLTIEYPGYICNRFNDFFIALLNSIHTSNDPALQNPADMNLAMDAAGNPVGVNLAASGLFTQCKPVDKYSATSESCIGTGDLEGTGFEDHGGTGWLTTRGNVVGGEVITLRLAIWDLGDHALDSLVLIDNFKWDAAEYTPGTGQY